jgi:glycosyltransferase involved in cell wall biosynthesis
MPRHVLVLEPDARGHAEEWLQHIVRFVRDEPADVEVTLAVPQSLTSRLSAEAGRHPRIHIHELTASDVERCLHPKLAVGAFARWLVMRRCLAASGAQDAFFLCIDSLTLPFALGLGVGRDRRASGILFRPSVHYETFGRGLATFGERVRDWRKRVLYPLMLKNKSVATVHTLDPYFPEYARQRYVAGDKVVALPDPIAEAVGDHAGKPRTSRFPHDRVSFLLFGELTQRKGIIELLEACMRLNPDAAKRISVLLAGRIDPPLEGKVRDLIRSVRSARPELWIEIDDRRLSFAELASAVDACDVVLAPYQRFVGSSGVLIWAARMLRPVITQRYGLLGRLVRDYGLGMAVETTSPDALAEAMEHAVRIGAKTLIDAQRARKFLAEREGNGFAARVLGVALSTNAASLTDARGRRASSG